MVPSRDSSTRVPLHGGQADARPQMRLRRVLRQRPIVLALLAASAYVPGFWWGAPYATAADRTNAWGVDDEPPLGPLAQAHDIFVRKKEINPNLGYPMLHPFMVLGAYAPYVGYLALSGGLKSPTVSYPHGFDDPVTALRNLTWIAHFLSVLLGVGIVLCAFGTARELWDETTGVFSAIGAMLVYPMFYYARNSNVDVPVLFFTAAALWTFAVVVMRGLTIRRAALFGALAGCAVATKEPSFASFVFVPFVLPFLRDPADSVPLWRRARLWRAAGVATLAAAGAYALGSGMVVDFVRWKAHLAFIRERVELGRAGGVAFAHFYPNTLEGHAQYAQRILAYIRDALSAPGLALGIVGIVLTIWQRKRSAILALSALGYVLVLFVSARVIQLRYVMPVTLILAIYAGYALTAAWRSRFPLLRWGTATLGVAAGATLLLWAIDLTDAMLSDSRYAAAAWLSERARPGDALEYFGSEHKHPPMPSWLTSRQAIPFRGSLYRADTSAVAVAAITSAWRERHPRFVVLVPDYTSAPGAAFAASCPPAIYRALEDGSLGYRHAVRFQSLTPLAWARRPPLDHPVVNPPIRIYERVAEPGS
jgi:4-amino-4-deoxy-L-arabinose transferase-like glycosyltransferase